jgi:hypothetical protein
MTDDNDNHTTREPSDLKKGGFRLACELPHLVVKGEDH